METLRIILTSLGGTAAGLAIAAFFSRGILAHYFARQVENYKAKLNRENEIAIENIRSESLKADKLDDRSHEYAQIMRRYQGPLLHAVYDLQSRLFGIVTQNLFTVYVQNGTEWERKYVVCNTAFVLAQYFAWTEIVRNEVQFIDFVTSEKSRQFSCLQHELYSLWRADAPQDNFRLWSGEQRAIGELMIETRPNGQTCIGFAKFMCTVENDEQPVLSRLVADIASLANDADPSFPRFTDIQHALIKLLHFLDPEYTRFPRDRRLPIAREIAKRRTGDLESSTDRSRGTMNLSIAAGT